MLSDKKEHSLRECVELISKHFALSEDEKKTMLPSGNQLVIHNRTSWAKTYLMKAGLIESAKRGIINITERGINELNGNPTSINQKYLLKFPEFVEFKKRDKNENGNYESNDTSEVIHDTPEEIIENAHQQLNAELSNEILQKIKNCSPGFFERLVVDLLLKMGYGGSRKNAGQAIGQSGDEGIDGVISEDKLGLDNLYIQAKRWDNTVGRPDIQKFVGALTGQRSRKGIFITTSSFSKDAYEYVQKIETKIVLIDGKTLASLMIDHNVGVSCISTYEIKKIDSDYFSDE